MNRSDVGRTRAALRRGLARRLCRAPIILHVACHQLGDFSGNSTGVTELSGVRQEPRRTPTGALHRRGSPGPRLAGYSWTWTLIAFGLICSGFGTVTVNTPSLYVAWQRSASTPDGSWIWRRNEAGPHSCQTLFAPSGVA